MFISVSPSSVALSKMLLDTEAVLCSGFFFPLAFLVWVVICHNANLREACSAIVRGGGPRVILLLSVE